MMEVFFSVMRYWISIPVPDFKCISSGEKSLPDFRYIGIVFGYSGISIVIGSMLLRKCVDHTEESRSFPISGIDTASVRFIGVFDRD